MAQYESEHTQFMREWLAQHPEEIRGAEGRPRPLVGQGDRRRPRSSNA